MTKILTYNLNGIRSALSKGWADWLKSVDADIICVQELKAHPEQFDTAEFEELGYHAYWYPAQKKGYSGTAILSKNKPKHVEYGCTNELFNSEGRIIRADFETFSVMSVYFPSGSSGDSRQDVKMQFLEYFESYINDIKKTLPGLIICGDYNICHKPIDIHDPVGNKNSSGFLPEEREWLDGFIHSGYADSFRELNTEPHNYTWWSFRSNARARNKGWRIDYILIDRSLLPALHRSVILSEAKHSDHCPVLTEINL
jgi:exodeoxyribonuclease-3